MDSYTVNISSTDGQQLCGSQTTGGNATSVVLDVTGCVMCQGSNKSYSITVKASNRGGQTTSTTSLCKIMFAITTSTTSLCKIMHMFAIAIPLGC